ncbi:unnamed protein product [Rhizoctonia solani]|uniref:Uncharacterized protein n=1 Tax=Rhizoctonia solani TaxID=456999 RepID=A0A8H2XWN2_9AGAM|nr:unnamed protein product [Rhizoctonia solani]
MHFPAIATGFRVLAECFIKSSAPSSLVGEVPAVSSTTSIVDTVMKLKSIEEPVTKSSETISKPVEKNPIVPVDDYIVQTVSKKTEPMGNMRSTAIVSQSRTDSSKVQVECTTKQGILQARMKEDMGLVAVKYPIIRSVTRQIERDEADELMEKVMEIFNDMHEMERYRRQLRVPAFDEDLEAEIEYEEDPIYISSHTRLDTAKEAEIALDIARCEMTADDVDELLARLYTELNRRAVQHGESKEERKRLALEVSAKIKEYAKVLLESECEIRLAVERARLRSVVAKRFTSSDAQYLALLAPGSSHIPTCDGSCMSTFLPHRLEKNEFGQVPELTTSEGSRCSTPSEVPSTPRAPIDELEEEPDVMVIYEPRPVEVASAKFNMMVKRIPARKAIKIARGGKLAWRF